MSDTSEVLALVRERRRAVVDLRPDLVPAAYRLVTAGVLRLFHDGPAEWLELDD